MERLLVTIAQGLVEHPGAVTVQMDEPSEDDNVVYHLHVAEDDMSRIIGKQGCIAKAIRVVMRAAATRTNDKVSIEIGWRTETVTCPVPNGRLTSLQSCFRHGVNPGGSVTDPAVQKQTTQPLPPPSARKEAVWSGINQL